MAVELASKAGLAEGAGGALGANGEATDKLLLHHRAQIIEIDMATALVPQGEVLVAGGGCRECWLQWASGCTQWPSQSS